MAEALSLARFMLDPGMLVHAKLSGYYDWAPVPADVEVTEDDKLAKLVKPMANDAWHMRVERAVDTHNDCNIPELAICDRMASLELLGRGQSRVTTVVEMLRATYEHHMDASRHLVAIAVHDSGPDRGLYAMELTRLGVTGARADAAMKRYLSATDIAAYLNVVFETKGSK